MSHGMCFDAYRWISTWTLWLQASDDTLTSSTRILNPQTLIDKEGIAARLHMAFDRPSWAIGFQLVLTSNFGGTLLVSYRKQEESHLQLIELQFWATRIQMQPTWKDNLPVMLSQQLPSFWFSDLMAWVKYSQIILFRGTIKVAILATLIIRRRLESGETVKIDVMSPQETTDWISCLAVPVDHPPAVSFSTSASIFLGRISSSVEVNIPQEYSVFLLPTCVGNGKRKYRRWAYLQFIQDKSSISMEIRVIS